MTIRIYAKKYERKDGGKPFFGYSLYLEDKKIPFTQVKFTMEAGNPPIKEQGYYLINVLESGVKKETTPNGKDVNILWVRVFEDCRRDNAFENYVKEKKQKATQDFLKEVGIE